MVREINIVQDVFVLTDVVPQSVLPSAPVSLEYPLRRNMHSLSASWAVETPQ